MSSSITAPKETDDTSNLTMDGINIITVADAAADGKNEEIILDDDYYMRQALKVAKNALAVGEVPVGCVIVLPSDSPHCITTNNSSNSSSNNIRNNSSKDPININIDGGVIVSHGANQVNATRDATRHAEVVAIDRLLTGGCSSDQLRLPISAMASTTTTTTPSDPEKFHHDAWVNVPDDPTHWKNTYGWQSGRRLPLKALKDCHLYVTCEPCIMCSAALAQVGIGRVVFGCRNDRFGGCGSILNLHHQDTASQLSSNHTPYPITEGVLKEEAIHLLRSFYDRENFHAPDDKRKRKEPTIVTTATTTTTA